MRDALDSRFAAKASVVALLVFRAALSASPVQAHSVWADGSPVPDWVQNACCDGSEIHHLAPEQVRLVPDGYRIEGIKRVVPFSKTLTSQDGNYWIFYRDYADGTQYVFCLFVPPAGF